MAYEQFSDYRGDTQEARDAAQEAWDAKQEKQKKYDDNRAPGEWLMTKSVYRMGARGCAFLAELEAEWFTLSAQEKKKWRLIDEWSSTTFTAMQLDLGMVLRVLKMKDYGIGKKHYTYEGGGGEPWTATPKSGAGGGVQPLWDALPAEIHQQHQMSKKAAMNKTKMGLAARLRRNATSVLERYALAVADVEALAKQEAWLASPEYQEQQALAEFNMKKQQALAKAREEALRIEQEQEAVKKAKQAVEREANLKQWRSEQQIAILNFEKVKGDVLQNGVVSVDVAYTRDLSSRVFSDSKGGGNDTNTTYLFRTNGTFRRAETTSWDKECGNGEMDWGSYGVISTGNYSATGTLVRLIAQCTITDSQGKGEDSNGNTEEPDKVGESFEFDATKRARQSLAIDPTTPQSEWKNEVVEVAWTAHALELEFNEDGSNITKEKW